MACSSDALRPNGRRRRRLQSHLRQRFLRRRRNPARRCLHAQALRRKREGEARPAARTAPPVEAEPSRARFSPLAPPPLCDPQRRAPAAAPGLPAHCCAPGSTPESRRLRLAIPRGSADIAMPARARIAQRSRAPTAAHVRRRQSPCVDRNAMRKLQRCGPAMPRRRATSMRARRPIALHSLASRSGRLRSPPRRGTRRVAAARIAADGEDPAPPGRLRRAFESQRAEAMLPMQTRSTPARSRRVSTSTKPAAANSARTALPCS
jgi:hypothetical protein